MSAERIAEFNDRMRWIAGSDMSSEKTVVTAGISALPTVVQVRIVLAVREFTEFTPDNDPHGEHDFGSFYCDEHHVFWKIDYYNVDMTEGSEDPSDPDKTTRVLTIMLAEEY